MYYHFNEGSRKRGATVAATVVEDRLVCGVSICRDGDQFNKKIGRTIASGRVLKRPQWSTPLAGRDPKKVFLQHARYVAASQIAKYERR